MSGTTAAVYAATLAAGLVAAAALLASGAGQTRVLLWFVLAVAAGDLAALLHPALWFTPGGYIAREVVAASVVVAWAVEIAAGLPARAASLVRRGLAVVVASSALFTVAVASGDPRAAYRSVATVAAGASAALAWVLIVVLLWELALSRVVRHAAAGLCAYYLVLTLSLAPFEVWWRGRRAQVVAAAIYVVAMLWVARAASGRAPREVAS